MKAINTSLLFLFLTLNVYCQSGSTLFDNTYVHEIRLEVNTPNFWDTLLINYEQIELIGERIYIPAFVTIDSNSIDSVGLRIKGFFSASANGKKKPLKIDFNEFIDDLEYEGIKKLNLQNSFEDPTSMRDMLAYNIFNTENINASRTAYTRVYINDEYWGLYLMVEQIDKTFLDERFNDDSGNLYKSMSNGHLAFNGSNYNSYTDYIALKTNEEENDWSRFIDFVEILNREYLPSNKEYEEAITRIFDVNSYLKVLAIDILLLNWDSYYWHGRNYYIYDNPTLDQFAWIPWDYNLAFSDFQIDVLVTENGREQIPLIDNLLNRPIFLQAYLNAFSEILEDNFTSERLFPIIDSTEKLISVSLLADSNKFFEHKVFETSLHQDTTAVVTDSWTSKFNLENTFFIQANTPQQRIDSAVMAGANIIDTNNMGSTTISLDTLISDSDTIVQLVLIDSWESERNIIGLKPFIDRRIHEVIREVSNVVIPEDRNSITTLFDKSEIVVYPNPAKDFIIISGLSPGAPFEAEITDISGKLIHSSNNQEIIYLHNLPSGVYFLKLTTIEGIEIRKFLKK